jgi:hypothetical protein
MLDTLKLFMIVLKLETQEQNCSSASIDGDLT